MILLSDYQYFPSVNLLSTLIKSKHINFELYETYQKGGFRNRCEVLGSNGVVQLIVPLLGGRTQKTLIKEVKIDYKENWQRSHFRTLLSCYNRSAFFEYYRVDLEGLFQKRISWLVDWNLACFEWLVSPLKLEVIIGTTNSFEREYPGEDFRDVRGLLDPRHRALAGIKLVRYAQVFTEQVGFVPGLSMLDLLFCEGPGAKIILEEMGGEES